MDSFESDYREERRQALRDQYLSGDRGFWELLRGMVRIV